ncbi:hypothetical protein HDV02_005671, partial [Globomyces sp. JEL0801]
LYHYGDTYPWVQNLMPAPGKAEAIMTGQRPFGHFNFYEMFSGSGAGGQPQPKSKGGKPFIITETGAPTHLWVKEPNKPGYVPDGTDPDTRARIKQAWWRQMINADFLAKFPKVRAIQFFEYIKPEETSFRDFTMMGPAVKLDSPVGDDGGAKNGVQLMALQSDLRGDLNRLVIWANETTAIAGGTLPLPSPSPAPGTGGKSGSEDRGAYVVMTVFMDGSLYFKLENITNYSLAIHHPDAIYIKYKDLAIPTTYKIITNRARDIYTLLLASPLPTRKVSKKLSRKLSRKSSTKQIHDIKNQKSSEEDLEFPSHDLAFHTLPSAPVQSNTPDFNLVPVERSNSFTHSPMHSTMPPKLTKRVSRFFKKLIKPKSNNDLKNVDNSDSTKKVPVKEDQNLNGSQTLQRGRFGIVHHEMSTHDTLHKKFNKLNLEDESIKFDDTSAHVHFRESFDQNASNVSFIHENHSSEFGLDVTSNEMDAADTYSLPDDSQCQRDSDNLDSSDSL